MRKNYRTDPHRKCACGSSIDYRNKSGLCNSCRSRSALRNNCNTPAARAKASAARANWTPEQRAARSAHLQNRVIPPEEAERRRQHGLWLAQRLKNDPEIRARRGEIVRKAWEKRRAEAWGWLPAEYEPLYRRLIATKNPAAEAKEIVLAQIDTDRQRVARERMAEAERRRRTEQQQAY